MWTAWISTYVEQTYKQNNYKFTLEFPFWQPRENKTESGQRYLCFKFAILESHT